MTERLSVEQVVALNILECSDTDETSALLDAAGLEAAVGRPWSGFGDFEAFPTLYDKAAALLHGIAGRQAFENGNKRTAWVAAVTLLEINGVDIGAVETVQSDMFVRAAALDHTLEISDLSEWFSVAHRRAQRTYATDPRVEYLIPAVAWVPGDMNGTIHVANLQIAGVVVTELPIPVELALILRIHWNTEDVGRAHRIRVVIEQDRRVLAFRTDSTRDLDPPAPSGHPHHRDALMPHLISLGLDLSAVTEGRATLVVLLDEEELGRVPLNVSLVSSFTV